MTAPSGRVLQRGRTPARVVLTWAASTAALVLLDRWLGAFDMPTWW